MLLLRSSFAAPASRLFAFFTLVVGLAALPVALAEGSAAAPRADKGKPLPVQTSFEKTSVTDAPPYVLKVKNTSNGALKVSATVLLSVLSHNRDKAREHPAQAIEPGQTWTIGELAALDKVILKADGYEPLQLEVK